MNDVAFNAGPFISPEHFNQIIAPYLRREVRHVRRLSVIPFVHVGRVPSLLSRTRLSRAELNRIQVGVFHSEPQTDRLTAKVAHIRSVPPLEHVFCFVTIEFGRIRERMSFVRLAIRIKANAVPDVSTGGSGGHARVVCGDRGEDRAAAVGTPPAIAWMSLAQANNLLL